MNFRSATAGRFACGSPPAPYKSVKFITNLMVTDSLKSFGKGLGSASPETGYAWYAGI